MLWPSLVSPHALDAVAPLSPIYHQTQPSNMMTGAAALCSLACLQSWFLCLPAMVQPSRGGPTVPLPDILAALDPMPAKEYCGQFLHDPHPVLAFACGCGSLTQMACTHSGSCAHQMMLQLAYPGLLPVAAVMFTKFPC